MGLSGRKVKQRIANDPRNLCWADDAARFGASYLSKFGWDASKGLGASGEGRLSHVKVSQKLDMMGIGAAHQNDPNGIAWKQNRDFENLLKRLNEAEQGTAEGVKEAKIGGFFRARNEELKEVDSKDDVKERKRKHKGDDAGKEKVRRKNKKRSKDEKTNDDEAFPTPLVAEAALNVDVPVIETTVKRPSSLPRHRSHRARAIAAKNISSKSANHISEILGIAPTPSSSSTPISGSATPQEGKLTSLVDEDTVQIDQITTSTKSVADYFKEKLKARASTKPFATLPPPALAMTDYRDDFSDEPSRRGIGASSSTPAATSDPYEVEEKQRLSLESSRIRFEDLADNSAQKIGLSQFSQLTSSTFLSIAPPSLAIAVDVEHPKKEKKDKKKKREEVAEEKQANKKRKKYSRGKAKAEATEHEPQAVIGKDKTREERKERKRLKALEKETRTTDSVDDTDRAVNKKKRRKDSEEVDQRPGRFLGSLNH